MDVRNAINALRAAVQCLECLDADSALGYAAVAVAEILTSSDTRRPKLGEAMLYMTDDVRLCVEAGTIDPPPDTHRTCANTGRVS